MGTGDSTQGQRDQVTGAPPRRTGLRLVLLAALLAAGLVTVAAPPPPAGADGNEAPNNPAAFRALTAGGSHTCAILANGSVRCWGYNSSGQLGVGDTTDRGDGPNEMGAFLPAVGLGTGRTATAITAGGGHTCALLDNNTVKCWGENDRGQLGQGDTTDRGDGPNEMGDNLPAVNLGTGRTATAITADDGHTCALLDNNTVKCWGLNHAGQLGQGDTTIRGDGPNEMGDNLPAVNLGTGRTATAITAGGGHTCALLDNNTVKCWGLNVTGELGLGDTTIRGDGPNEMGDNLPAVNLGTGRSATAITAANQHTCALLDNATIKCWGHNGQGQLGLGDTTGRGDGPNEMGDNLPAVNLGTGRTATAISLGGGHTCARLDNNTVKCWGRNSSGQLGQGDTTYRGDGPNEMGDNLPAVNLGTGRTATAITAAGVNTCARLDNATIKCWGENVGGQLGQEDTVTRGDNGTEMGDNLPIVFLPPAGLMTGTITDATTNQPIAGINVVALRTSDFGTAAAGVTNGSGEYLMQAPTGTYFLYLVGPSGGHVDGFLGAPTLVTVTDGATTDTDDTRTPTRGAFSGTVTDQGTGTPVATATVFAIGPSGIAGSTTTAPNGSYTIAGLAPGSYRAVFLDGVGRRVTEYWDNSPDYEGAAVINVTAGTTTANVNAALLRP